MSDDINRAKRFLKFFKSLNIEEFDGISIDEAITLLTEFKNLGVCKLEVNQINYEPTSLELLRLETNEEVRDRLKKQKEYIARQNIKAKEIKEKKRKEKKRS